MKVFETDNKPIKAWTDFVPPIEDEAMKQLKQLAGLPFIYKHVAVMPDVHAGKGSTIGSVIATKGAIIPAAVGVDIGCGMMAVRTTLKASDLPDSLSELRLLIEEAVPHGRSSGEHRHYNAETDKGLHKHTPEENINKIKERNLNDRFRTIFEKAGEPRPFRRQFDNMGRQLGTLGTGNHFIELCLDEQQEVWVMLHSGSRGIGNSIGSYFIEKAKKDMQRWFINLPDKDLAYIPDGSDTFNDYIEAVEWAQEFAFLNREIMMGAVLSILRTYFNKKDIYVTESAVNCHHNYVSRENFSGQNVLVTRKGAVRARFGELGIIPGSMGAKSFIVRGKGNGESFCSCSHGAGRVMSRTKAEKTISLEDHIRDTAGVECRKDSSVLDESPRAYKNIDDVMKSQEDLVEIVHTLKQCLCIKG